MNWVFSVGFYPGILFGMRTYTESNKHNHLVYIPLVDFCLTVFKSKKRKR